MYDEVTVHRLKILPQYYNDVFNDAKRCEIRKNDRDYKVLDLLLLQEWDGKKYTDRSPILRVITHILTHEDFPDGVPEGYVVLSIKRLERRHIV